MKWKFIATATLIQNLIFMQDFMNIADQVFAN
jgi:hypothetical protein